MQKEKVVYGVVVASLILILGMSVVSAGFWDSIKNAITGEVTNQPTNVSVNVRGSSQCVVNYVSPISAVTPSEAGSVSVTFEVHVYDQDGFNDINQTSVYANFSKAGQTTRLTGFPGTCTFVNNLVPRAANFTCTITMWYWDGSGAWNINVAGNDLGNKTECINGSSTFTYNLLKAMIISPPALTWNSLSAGDTNQLASNHPTIVNNTGNFNGILNLTGINLLGQTNPADSVTADNFTVARTSGAACTGDRLANATGVGITSSNSNPGNLSAGAGAGQENIYYCIPSVPYVSSQTYSTSQGGSWIVAY